MAAKEFPFAVVIKAVDRVTGPMRPITAALSRFESRVRATGRGVSDRLGLPVLGAAAGKLGGALGELGRRVALLTGGLAAMGAAATLAAWQMVQSFADTGGELNDLSQSLGISAERLQELRYAAKQTGVENGIFDQGLRVLSRNLGDAFTKNKGPVFDVLEGMGVRLRGANGEMRRTDDLLPEIADKLAAIRDPAVRAAAAQALLGRAGVKMLPMLLGGSKGLAQFAARARELGIVIDNDTIAAADEFGDQLDDMKSSLTGVRNVIGAALLPQLQKLVTRITDFTIRNRAKIQAFFDDFAAKMPERIDAAIKVLGDMRTAVQPVIDAVGWLVDKFGGANVALGAIGAVVAVTLIPALYATATAIYAVGAAILATPIGWIILGVTALVSGLVYLYNRFEFVRKAMDAIGAAAVWLFKNFTPLGYIISRWDELKERYAAIYEALRPLGRAIAWVFMNMTPLGLTIKHWDKLKVGLDFVWGALSAVGRAIAWVFMNMTPLGLTIQNWDALSTGLGWVWEKLKAVGEIAAWAFLNFTPLGQMIQHWDMVKAAIDAVSATFSDMWEGMKSGLGAAIGWVDDLAGRLTGMVPDWAQRMFGDGGPVAPALAARGAPAGAAMGAQQAAQAGRAGQDGEVRVRVDLGNLPPGSKTRTETSGRPNFELNQGFAMGVAG